MSKAKADKPKLSVRQNKFVAEVIKGKTKTAAYKEIYKPQTTNEASIYRQAHGVSSNHLVKAAIERALEHHGATPEFAVGRLKEIAEQNKEIGAARLASKDILELNGWQRGDRPSVSLDIQNAFFTQTRDTN